jgi:hypothetical protein
MSTSRPLFCNADSIGLSFVTARASQALTHLLNGVNLGDEDRDALSKGSRFLLEISNGADISVHGTIREGVSPSRSLEALEVAFGPMDALRTMVSSEEDMAKLFRELADAVSAVAGGTEKPALQALRSARDFFEALQRYVAQDLVARTHPLGSLHRNVA